MLRNQGGGPRENHSSQRGWLDKDKPYSTESVGRLITKLLCII